MKLPKTIYVKVVNENDGTEYFVADNSIENLILETGNKIMVGIYELVETCKAEGVVKTHQFKAEGSRKVK